MRIHSLDIQGFGPFKEKQETIDFNRLTMDRLFMLEGPTGAGKSSIIDAIVWVLYGRTAQQAAREAADIKGGKEFGDRVHSDFLEPDQEARVVMEFSVNESRYRVTRTQRFSRKKKGSEEYVPQTTQRLEFLDSGLEPLTKDIHDEIYRILQMNLAQFSQLVVLPQAAFDTFLRAKSEARGEVLRSIFKTYFFENLEKHLSTKSKEIAAELEDNQDEIKHHLLNLISLATNLPDLEIDEDEEKEFFTTSSSVRPRSNKDARLDALVTKLMPNLEYDLNAKKALKEEQNPLSEEAAKLRSSIENIDEKASKEARLEELIAQKPEISGLEESLTKVASASGLKVLKNAIEEIQQRIANLDQISDELEGWTSTKIAQKISELEPEVKRLTVQVGKNESLERELQTLELSLKIANAHELAIKELPKLDEKLKDIEQQIAQQKIKNKNYEAGRSESWVYEAAQALKRNKPCPVCGSKEHPQPVTGKVSFDEEEFVKMVAKLDALVEERLTLKSQIAVHKPHLEKVARSSAEIKIQIKESETRFAASNDVLLQLSTLEKELVLLRENLDIVKAVEQNSQDLQNAREKFQKELKKVGLEEDSFNELMLLDVEFIKDTINQYKSEVSGIQAILKQEQFANLPKSSDELTLKLEALDAQINSYDIQIKEIDDRIALSNDRIQRITIAKSGITQALDAIESIYKEHGSTLQLSKIANGHNVDALSLTSYVLQERLAMILERASLHLLKISNYKFEFKLNEDKGSSRKTAGLGITVIDHVAGRERPAETLSGGETFYASLSLCLGMAEVVKMDRGGIELGTLFIDEGFGSLSQDKLTEVLEVLNKMRDDGRIIGIITHLEDMKAQIPMRLKVFRTPAGPSKVLLDSGGDL